VIGRGATRPAGQAHAEAVALEQARRLPGGAEGATLYVTLEPCSHIGRTPPCARAIIEAGVAKVVAASPDPNPLVSGKGFAMLRRAGIAVDVAAPGSAMRARAEEFYGGFFFWVRHGRPRIVVKIAQSLDGRINARAGVETVLTGPEARRFAHSLRARGRRAHRGQNLARR
jgi:diaminohydroxyphosphoribosylaminopyrimidine deaminase/5-amino-6-(5-phosphoribosylamino)uracil reductase